MQASANAVKEIRDRAVKVFGGSSVEVDEWEIAFLHDVQHKATKHTIGLASWHKVDPAEVDSWVDNWKKFIQGGLGPSYPRDFRSANAAVNRTSGRIMALLCYDLSGEPYPKELSGDSYAAMEEPDNPMRKQAEQIIEAIGHKASVGTAEDMWFFDFGLGHFWVP